MQKRTRLRGAVRDSNDVVLPEREVSMIFKSMTPTVKTVSSYL